MAQTIKLKRSATQNAVPSTSSLALGELAINTYDGKLFIKKNVSGTESIVTIGEVGAGSIGPTELASTAVTAGSYGSTSAIPVITIDEDGRITSASTATISGLSADSVTATEIAANAVGISELNVSDGTDGQVLTTDGNGNLAFEDQSGGAASATAFSTNIASGDGSTTAFTLSESPSAESKIIAFINGVFQNQDAYTISGTTLTFDTAPISGTNNVVVYVIGDVYSGESVLISNFSGDSSTTAFTLANNPGNENNTQVYIDGVYQQKTTYSVSGTTLTFSSAPPTGTNNIEVVMLTSTTVNTPAAGSVVTASMADDSVTASKIVSSAVTTAKIADSNVTTAKIADSNVTTAKIADSNVTTAKIADDAVTIGKIADAALVIESEGIGSNDNDTTLPTSAAVKDYVDTQVAGKDALSELSGDTDDVTEGSTNLYYTDARADARITNALKDEDNMASNSATHIPSQQSVKAYVDSQVASKDALSELSGNTDDVTEGSTNLYYTDARVGTYISGDRTYGNITTTGYLAGPSTFTIDPAAVGDNTGTLVIAGNLQVDGTTTTVNSTTLTVDDKLITLGSGSANAGAANGAGIEVDISGATNPSLTYDGTNDEWDFNKDINITGAATMDGLTVDGAASNYNTIQFTSGSTSHGTIINLGDTSDVDYGSITQFATSASEGGRMRFIAGTTETMNLRGGKVGIGIDNPGQLLHVQGTNTSAFIQVGNNNGSVLYGVNTAGNAFVSGQTSSKDLIFEVNNGNNMRLHNSGKLGIGTGNTTPTGKLTIANPTAYAPNTVTAANSYIQLGSTDYGSGGSSSNDGKFMIGFGYTDGTTNTHSPAYIGYEETSTSGDTKGNLTFYTRNVVTDTAPSERMRIDTSGLVSIGNTDASSMDAGANNLVIGTGSGTEGMTIYSGTANSGVIYFADGTSGDDRFRGQIGYSHGDNAFNFRTNASSSPNMTIDSSGNLIMTAGGTIRAGGVNDLILDAGESGTPDIYLQSGGATKVKIEGSNGNVGIGTTGPQTALSFGESASATGITFLSTNTGFNSGKVAAIRGEVGGTGYGALAFDTFAGGSGGGERMRITATGATQILHGGTAYYTSFEDNNEINTYTSAGANSTMYLQHPGGDLDVGAGVFVLDRTDKRVKIRNSTYNSSNIPLYISNGTEGPGAIYDTVVISQDDVPCIRLDETATGQELTLAVGNENSNNAVIGSTGKITLATNRNGGISGYTITNSMVVIDTSQVLMNTSAEIKSTDDQILTLNQNDTGGWNYIGYESQGTRKWYLGMDNSSNFTLGSDVGGATFEVTQANLRAPGVIVQTVRASVENVVGTGDFDVLSVNITPKFSNSDIIVHFYTQWSVLTNNGEDWGLQLQRDGTAILGDSQNSYFINGGGVDATDYASQFSNPNYYVRTASKTDIDTGRSSGTSQITYKIRKVVPANTSTKTVRFGVDGWTGSGVESQRSLNVLMVQEVLPN